jgi:hypothetical protein
MPRQKSSKPRKPTLYQAGILKQIYQSPPLIKTYSSDHKVLWSLANGTPVPDGTVKVLIRNNWLKPNRDGLSMFDDSQTYVALKPGPQI